MLNRKKIKEQIIEILWLELIEKIDSYGKFTSFFPYWTKSDALIKLWNDITDGWWNWISINSYDLVLKSFPDIEYSEYKKIEEAINFLMKSITNENWSIRSWFIDYIEDDIYWFIINLS